VGLLASYSDSAGESVTRYFPVIANYVTISLVKGDTVMALNETTVAYELKELEADNQLAPTGYDEVAGTEDRHVGYETLLSLLGKQVYLADYSSKNFASPIYVYPYNFGIPQTCMVDA
jgi:hypothetical protein